MTWIEQTQGEFIIKTGDSKEFRPLWVNTQKAIEYNIAEFTFPDVSGSLVKRGQPKGRKFPLEFYFQGDDHLVEAQKFELSANDPRPWVVTHPLYGVITVQPSSITIDNTDYNVSKITSAVIETIVDDNPKITIVPLDKIIADKAENDLVMAQAFANNNPAPSASDVANMSENNTAFYNAGKVSAYYDEKQAAAIEAAKNGVANVTGATDDSTSSEPSTSEKYINAYNDANTALADAQDSSATVRADAMKKIMDVISFSAEMKISVLSRIKLITDQYTDLKYRLNRFTPIRKSQKHLYENNGGTMIASLAIAAALPLNESDYENKENVLSVIDKIITAYNLYIEDLDAIQTDNGGQEDGYIPDANCLMRLNALINYTVSNLFAIALNAKQERVLILEDDSNLILLAHRFYGLLPDDSTLHTIIKNNKIGLNEMLKIKKGRKIIYYV